MQAQPLTYQVLTYALHYQVMVCASQRYCIYFCFKNKIIHTQFETHARIIVDSKF